MVLTAALPLILCACAREAPSEPFPAVTANWVRPVLETPSVGSADDAADDPAIWVHPDDPAASLVLGTNKRSGLHVYDLEGAERAFIPGGNLNNVDVRTRPWGDADLSIAVASHRHPSEVVVFAWDHADLEVREVRRNAVTLTEPYGVCLYQDDAEQPWVILNDKDGTFVQYRLERDYSLSEARRFSTQSQPEGCVADDAAGILYVGEENYGVWRLAADPEAPGALESFASIANGNLTADVEGLALRQSSTGTLLVISSQGDNSYAIYDTASRQHLVSFHVGGTGGLDDVSETDGLDVTAASLPGFPEGLLVVQDGYKPDANQNFKFVSWRDVATLLRPVADGRPGSSL